MIASKGNSNLPSQPAGPNPKVRGAQVSQHRPITLGLHSHRPPNLLQDSPTEPWVLHLQAGNTGQRRGLQDSTIAFAWESSVIRSNKVLCYHNVFNSVNFEWCQYEVMSTITVMGSISSKQGTALKCVGQISSSDHHPSLRIKYSF